MALKVGELFAALGLDKSGYDKGLDSAEKRGKDWVGGLEGASSKAALALGAVGLAAGAGMVIATKSAMGYEFAISAVGAVAQATDDELAGLNATGLRIGKETAFSATEAASAMEVLAANGVSARDIMNGAADAAVALAAAGGTDLTTAADVASTAMTVWSLKTQDMTDVVNRLAGAANVSRFGVEDMAQAVAQGGGAAAVSGVEFGDFATAIAAIAPNFSSGSDAGTSFKTMLAALTPNSDAAATAMQELGIITKDGKNQFYDANGALKSFAEITDILHNATKDLTEEQKSNALTTIFGSDAMRAASGIAKITGAEFAEMSKKMGDTSAADVAARRLNNASGAMEQLKGSIETISIEIGTKLLPIVKDLANALATWLPVAFEKVGTVIQWFSEHTDVAIPVMLAFAGAIIGAVVPALIAWATAAWAAAAAMIAALAVPILIGVAIGLLVAAIILAIKHWDDITAAVERFVGFIRDQFVAAVGWVRDRIVEVFTAIRDKIVSVFEAVKGAIAGAWDWIVSKVTGAINNVVSLFTFLYEHVGRFAQVVDFVRGAFQAYIDFYVSAWELIRDMTIAVVTTIADFLTDAFTMISGFLGGVWADISGAVSSAWNSIASTISDAAGRARDGVVEKFTQLTSWLGGIKDRILGVLGDVGSWLYDIGKQIIAGLMRGIEDKIADLMNLAGKIAGMVKSKLVKALDIHSPSRVMAEIGGQISAGLAQGMANGTGNVVAASQAMAAGIAGPDGARAGAASAPGDVGALHISVWIGDREITDIVRVEAERRAEYQRGRGNALAGGRA